MPRYVTRLTVDVYAGEAEAVALVNYCRGRRRPPTKELVLAALEACYGPEALEQEGVAPELVEKAARRSIAKLEAFILQIRHGYNIAVNPALYHPTVVAVPSMAIGVRGDRAVDDDRSSPSPWVSDGQSIPLSRLPELEGAAAQAALARFVGEDAEIILQEFPFGFSS